MKDFTVKTILVVALIIVGLTGLYLSINNGISIRTSFSFSNNSSSSYDGTEVTEHSYPFQNNGTLSISTDNGSISITAHDKNELIVKEIKSGDKNSFSLVKTKATITQNTACLKTVYTSNNNNNLSMSYEIIAPASTTITDARSDNGTITIKAIQQAVTAQSTNGMIELTDSAGPVQISTENGAISVKNCPRIASVTSSNGSIHIQNQNTESANSPTTITTENGSITFACTDCQKGTYNLSSSNGSISITLPESPTNYTSTNPFIGSQATFSSGQAHFSVQTDIGSLTIHQITR